MESRGLIQDLLELLELVVHGLMLFFVRQDDSMNWQLFKEILILRIVRIKIKLFEREI